MPDISTVILYVSDPSASGRFYASLLGHAVVEDHPNFAMLPMASGVMLGLWRRGDVQPVASSPAGAGELAIAVPNPDAIRSTYAAWQAQGVRFIQEPQQMDFGFTCTAVDPDGNRIRLMALS